MYILATAHTLDVEQRSGASDRSQNFKWYSASLLYYLCDRAAMYINQRFKTVVLSSSLVSSGPDSKMILIKLRRPALFQFEPGQYAFLKVDGIGESVHWHPFSIASDPRQDELEFYIEVYGQASWTHKLWDLLERHQEYHKQNGRRGAKSRRTIWVHVMGPYGTALAKTEEYSHGISIGSGTGVVPMLSLLKKHVRQAVRLEPEEYMQEMKEFEKSVNRVDIVRSTRKGSVAQKMYRAIYNFYNPELAAQAARNSAHTAEELRRNIMRTTIRSYAERHDGLQRGFPQEENRNDLIRAVGVVTRSMQGIVLITGSPVVGVALLGFTISWNTLPVPLYPGQAELLTGFSVYFFTLFGVISIGFWDGNHFATFLDVVFFIIGIFALWYWFEHDSFGNMEGFALINYCILTGYMTFRLWSQAVRTRHHAFREQIVSHGISNMERLTFVWVTRSAQLVSKIMPDINDVYASLVSHWGESAREVLRLELYVTDKDEAAVEQLKFEMAQTDLYRNGSYFFERPDVSKIIENHSLNMVATRQNSYTVLAFCGSPRLSQQINEMKIANDISVVITGNKYHQMEYVSESYGGYKPLSGKTVQQPAIQQNGGPKDLRVTRRTSSVQDNHSSGGSYERAAMQDASEGARSQATPTQRRTSTHLSPLPEDWDSMDSESEDIFDEEGDVVEMGGMRGGGRPY
eukprot:CAMPEP_0202471054 /NCGR_PEP_ID=MMETSP1360-20130828/83405_1 /ASSEMBLY_ACC=CAM_ASM_000848 /TAXON_ID=515479 /ORGANISM="Licmophora paradoxa, Strain CCMP2313" /LENGTH=687 /DNA_ID=CAMNT_0049096985 /DNA_START=495 /DNA_END=2558 /DNA_ORIENTATION=-